MAKEDTVFDIDLGGTGGSQGPWVNWQARESLDGSIPGRSFTIRDQDGSRVCDAFTRGVVADIDRLKTGWSRSSGAKGVAPEWTWNKSLAKFEPAPGDDWKRGFHLPIALTQSETAVWEQAQAGAWSGLVGLVALIQAAKQPPGKLPIVKCTGAEKVESKKGITYVPRLEIVRWVDRPAVLSGGAIDVGPAEPAPRSHATQPLSRPAQPQPEMAGAGMGGSLDDEMPF